MILLAELEGIKMQSIYFCLISVAIPWCKHCLYLFYTYVKKSIRKETVFVIPTPQVLFL